MGTKKAAEPKPRNVTLREPSPDDARSAKLKKYAGTDCDDLNFVLLGQVWDGLWKANVAEEQQHKLVQGAASALRGIAPQDTMEAMLAAQIVATHNASMECHRRAALTNQTFEGRKEALGQANKLSRTYATLMEALNRHRGKGQQKVTVEHVHVHAGGQAIVGAVEGGGGASSENQRQPHAQALALAPVAPLLCPDQEREPVPVSGDAER